MEIEEGKNTETGEGEEQGIALHLFKAKGIRHPEFKSIGMVEQEQTAISKYWRCLSQVALCSGNFNT